MDASLEPPQLTSRRRLVVTLLAVAIAVAACSGDDAGSGVASLEEVAQSDDAGADAGTTAPSDADVEQALLDFAACMRDLGVDIEDPTVDADGNVSFGRIGGAQSENGDAAVDREAMRAARQECSEHLEGVTLGFRRSDDAEFQDRLYEYAQCMRDNGIDMDDPDFSGPGPGTGEGDGIRGGPFGELDPTDPDFQAAQEACAEILGEFVPGAGRPPADVPPGGSDG